MPVSLCEWRTRIGTYIHWIRDYEIRERKERLLKERIRRMKVLCERLRAKKGDSDQESEEDGKGESREDGSSPMKRKQCPHKSTNIQSSGNSAYIKDLLTSCDQCIQDLLTQNYSHIEKILTQSDTSTEHLLAVNIAQNDSCLKDLLSVPNSSRNHQHTSCGGSSEELTQNDSKMRKLLTQSDSCIKELLSSVDSRKDDMPLSTESCRIYQPVQSDSTANDLFSQADSDSVILLVPSSTNTELQEQSDTYVQDLLNPRDTSINELLTARDSSLKELLTPRDSSYNELPTPKHSSIKESLTPRDYSINKLLTAQDSLSNDTQEDYLINELLTPRDSYVNELLTPRDTPRNELPTQRLTSLTNSPKPRDFSINELFTASDSSITELLTQEGFLIKELLTPKDSAVYEVLMPRDSSLGDLPILRDFSVRESLMPRDASINELLTPSDSSVDEFLKPPYSSIKEFLKPRDSSLKEVLKPRDASMNELLKPTESAINEVLTLRDFTINASLTPGDSDIRELLTLREEVLPKSGVKVHDTKKDFRKEKLVDDELKEMKSSYACRKDQLIGVGSMYPVEKTKNDESSRHRPRISLLASTSVCNVADNGLARKKGMSNESSNSSSICTQNLAAPVDGIYNPCLAELLLAKAGDVELNPGPLHGSTDSMLQESELVLLAKEVPGNCYTELCIGLGFSYMESQNVLTKHLMNIPGALIEFFCRWKVKQRDGTDCRAVLAEILGNADMGALQTKLLAGRYLTTDTSPSAPDTPQPLIDMTEEQVVQCGDDLQTFYREQMCKIKTDPLDFNSVLEFEEIYTNLTLLRSKTPLDYNALLATQVNGAIPKRLMVEGEGGVGKTTFCSKIAWDWVNGSSQFKQFSWVVVIPLRKIEKGQTIGDIVKNYLSDRNTVTPYQINNYILSEPTKVLIVLDGLDEYDRDLSAEDHSDVAQILRFEKFKECTVLVTTRPWKADQIKSNVGLSRLYSFIGVKGFSEENVSSYIKKYFAKDEKAGSELIQFIEKNDVIKENMAPFPIYVAMLCILWKNSDSEKRETMRRLKTFSQLFDQMVMFLRDHCVSKLTQILDEVHLGKEMENMNSCLLEIGPIAFNGLLTKRLTFNEKDFISCTKAMKTCCRIGVLTREKLNISRWERKLSTAQSVTTSVFFPHKLFQEYISALYLASLYDTDRKKYNSFLDRVISVVDPEEFRYLLYFTAAQGKDVGLNIVEKIQQNKVENNSHPGFSTVRGWDTGRAQRTRSRNDFLVDITFEAYDQDSAKSVGRRIFAEDKTLTIDEDMPAHTVSGYLFIMEQHGMETLIFRGRSCGPTVSRDLADVLCSSSTLSRLDFHSTTLDEDFFRLLQDRASSSGAKPFTSVRELYVDHTFLGDLQRFRVTVGDLFPNLQQLGFTSLQTVTPVVVERLTHPNLSVLSIKADSTRPTRNAKEGERWPVPLIGEPASLGQLFSSSFPQLTSLTFKDMVIGNIRCEAILLSLRNQKHVKTVCFKACFTDRELDSLAGKLSEENGITVSLDHDSKQQRLDLCGNDFIGLTPDMVDALCHRTCVCKLVVYNKGFIGGSMEWFSEIQGREVDSKIQTFRVLSLQLNDDPSASCCLGKFICLLPCLTDLTVMECYFHNSFYKEIAYRASSSKIQTFNMELFNVQVSQSACKQLAKFLCSLPFLMNLTLELHSNHFYDDFYIELGSLAASSQNPYFKNNKHKGMLEEWSARKERQQQFINQYLQAVYQAAYHHNPRSREQLDPNTLQPRQSAQPSTQHRDYHPRRIQSENEQAEQFPREGKHYSLTPGLRETAEHAVAQPLRQTECSLGVRTGRNSRNVINSFTSREGHSVEMTQMHRYDLDRPSTRPVGCSRSREHIRPNTLQPRRSARPSAQYQDYHPRRIQSEDEQIQRFPRERGYWSLNPGWRETSEHSVVQPSRLMGASTAHNSRNVIHSFTSREGHSVGMARMHRYDDDPDRPSTRPVGCSRSREQLRPNALHPRRTAQPSAQYHDNPPRRIHSENEQIQRFPRERGYWSLNPCLRETLQHAVGQPSRQTEYSLGVPTGHNSRNVIHSFTSREGHPVGMTQMHRYDDDLDRPSASRLSSAHSRIGTASLARKGRSIHVGKRSYSDSDSDNSTVSTSESKKRQSGKRRTKTDRNPDSP